MPGDGGVEGQVKMHQDDHADVLLKQINFLYTDDESRLKFTDVTLVCEGQSLPVHKVILASCSPHFRALLATNPCQHPIIIMNQVKHRHLRKLIDFIYKGEVTVMESELAAFIQLAETLSITGFSYLMSENGGIKKTNIPATPTKKQAVKEPSSEFSFPEQIPLSEESLPLPADDVWTAVADWDLLSSPHPDLCSELGQDSLGTCDFDTPSLDPATPPPTAQPEQEPATVNLPGTNIPMSHPTWTISSVHVECGGGGDTLICGICQRHFNTKALLRCHMEQSHNARDPKRHPCRICGKTYAQKSDLLKHQLYIHGEFSAKRQCPYCHKILKHKKSLDTHVRDFHSGKEEVVVCKFCNKVFNMRTKLQRHLRSVHIEEMENENVRFACTSCGNDFKHKDSLRHHIRDHHSGKPKGDRHACKLCQRSYRRVSDLRKHERNTHFAPSKIRAKAKSVTSTQNSEQVAMA